jgi:hypothetical protein
MEASLGIHISASVGGDGGGDLFGRAVLEGDVTDGGGWKVEGTTRLTNT